MAPFKIAFLGLGGVGGYFGAKLARYYANSTSVEIIFFARPETVTAITNNGISLTTPQETFSTHPHLTTSNAAEAGFVDVLIVSVKSYDLESSLQEFKACIGPDTIILPLLNGIDALRRIRVLFPKAIVWQGCVYLVARRISPGVIHETGNIHSLWFGNNDSEEDKSQQLLAVLQAAHADVFLSSNIENVLWEKFVFISTIANLTSALDKTIGEILSNQEHSIVLRTLLVEVVSVARKMQVSLPENIEAVTLAKMEILPPATTSSMHSDFKNLRSTELESLTGHVVHLGLLHQVPTPQFARIYSLLQNPLIYGDSSR